MSAIGLPACGSDETDTRLRYDPPACCDKCRTMHLEHRQMLEIERMMVEPTLDKVPEMTRRTRDAEDEI